MALLGWWAGRWHLQGLIRAGKQFIRWSCPVPTGEHGDARSSCTDWVDSTESPAGLSSATQGVSGGVWGRQPSVGDGSSNPPVLTFGQVLLRSQLHAPLDSPLSVLAASGTNHCSLAPFLCAHVTARFQLLAIPRRSCPELAFRLKAWGWATICSCVGVRSELARRLLCGGG
ncbi:hypothetical protein HJG60_007816 [Phyllostomus discolor]|uniref:Uncharacterized protein n=1 Tax=Phyllostomus discolor TaxID=89673 RepID=A0A834BKL0_9CHIR|nr:hypothetical protein HJG60_007816 [Phyllostomus discolor]